MKSILKAILCVFGVTAMGNLSAEIKGRVETAPVYMHIDVQESGKTKQKLDMGGIRGDATIVPFECTGLCFKPFAQGGWNKDSYLYQCGLGVGHYTPVNDWLTVIPIVGVSASWFKTYSDFPEIFQFDKKNEFRSTSFYLAGEAIVKLSECLYVTGIYQYAWARTHTTIHGFPEILEPFAKSKGESQGSNYAVVLDYYITPKLSISPAFAYTTSLSKEKHGLKGYGVKLGLAYLF